MATKKKAKTKVKPKSDVPGITLLDEYEGKKVGDRVLYRGSEWRIDRILLGQNKWGQSESTYEDSPAPVGFDLVWVDGDRKGPGRIHVGSHCLAEKNPLDAIVAATSIKDAEPTNAELDAIHDSRRITAHGRIFFRPTHPIDGPNGTKTKKTIIAGIVLGDIGVGGDGEWPEDELWLCDVIIIRPVQKFRESKCKGRTIDGTLLHDGLQPEGYTTPLTD